MRQSSAQRFPNHPTQEHAQRPALASLYAAVIQGMSVQAIDGASITQLCELADAAMLAWPHQDDEHRHGPATPHAE